MKKFMRTGRIILSVLFLLAVMAGTIIYIQPVRAEPIDTFHSSWQLIRETADQDGDTFALVYNLTTEGNFANKDSSTVANGGPYRIKAYTTGISTDNWLSAKWIFAFCGKNYDVANDNVVDNTFSFNIVGWSKANGMLQVMAEGDCILGTQAVIVYPDTGDALGELVSETSVTYTHNTETYTVTNGGFTGAAVGMMAYVTGTNLTDGYYAITTVTDVNTIIMSGMSSTDNNTDSTVQINPSFWVDTINLDETTKWPRDGDGNNVMVYNSGDNEVAFIVVETADLEWIQFVIYGADAATGIEAGDITVYGRKSSK